MRGLAVGPGTGCPLALACPSQESICCVDVRHPSHNHITVGFAPTNTTLIYRMMEAYK